MSEQKTLKVVLVQIKDLLNDFTQVYGSLMHNVYRVGEESTHVAKEFKKTADQVYLLEEGGYVYADIKKFSNRLKEMASFFHSNYHTDCSYVESVNNELESLKKLESMVKLMNETAIDMEIISINTLTVAVRAGKVGGAFSYITNEIKKLTQAMSSQAELLKSRVTTVNSSLDNCEENFTVILGQEKEIVNLLKAKIPESIALDLEKTKTLYTRYMHFFKEFSEVNNYVSVMVEYLQFQDTIAQSLENMSNVLSSYVLRKDDDPYANKEKYLDYLLLKERVYKTAQSIMHDLKHRCKENLNGFKISAEDMQNFLKKTIKIKSDIDQKLIHQGFFRASLDLSKTYSSLSETSFQLKSEFAKGLAPLLKAINSLRQIFDAITLIVTRFENINIASKIEVAKQKGLQGMEGNIREMTQLINVISRDLGGGDEVVSHFVASIEKIFNSYSQDLLKDEKVYRTFQGETMDFLNQITRHFKRVEFIMGSFSLTTAFMDGFYQTVSVILEDAKDLFKRVDDLANIFSHLYVEARAELEGALQENHLSTWEFSSNDYAETINHFKIYSYKMAMKENLGKKVVEDSVEEGEVILF